MIKCMQCDEEMNILQWTHLKYKCEGPIKTLTEYKQKYPDALLKCPEFVAANKLTLENFIRKYGEVDGRIRWDSYREKQAYSNSFEYKQEKHGWTQEQFDEYNSDRAQTLEKMIERHGEKAGRLKWKSYCDRQAYTNSIEYFIEEYGEEVGIKKYNDSLEGKTRTLEWCIARCNGDEDAGKDLFIEYKSKLFNAGTSNYSKMSQELFDAIENYILDTYNIELHSYYATKNSEFSRYNKYNKKLYMYDYVIPELKYCIEFNGDYYHANPEFYDPDTVLSFHGIKYIAKDLWEKDKIKNKFLEDLGFNVIVIWEDDYNWKKDKLIKTIGDEIYEMYNNTKF